MKILLIKIAVFSALIGTFYFLGGFDRPSIARESYLSSTRVGRAWFALVTMFTGGAVLAVWGNDIVELIDWHVPPGLYPAIGVLLLVAAFFWLWMIRSSIRTSFNLRKGDFELRIESMMATAPKNHFTFHQSHA